MANSQSVSLIIISKANGWDPTELVRDFNVPRHAISNPSGTGKLPQGTPDSFPEDHPSITVNQTTFSTPKVRDPIPTVKHSGPGKE